MEARGLDTRHAASSQGGAGRLEDDLEGSATCPVEDVLHLVLSPAVRDRHGVQRVTVELAASLSDLHAGLAQSPGHGGRTHGWVWVAPADQGGQSAPRHGLGQPAQLTRLELNILQADAEVLKSILGGDFGVEMLLDWTSGR